MRAKVGDIVCNNPADALPAVSAFPEHVVRSFWRITCLARNGPVHEDRVERLLVNTIKLQAILQVDVSSNSGLTIPLPSTNSCPQVILSVGVFSTAKAVMTDGASNGRTYLSEFLFRVSGAG